MRTILLHGLTAISLALAGLTLSGCDVGEEGAVEEEEQEGEEEDD